MKLTASPYQLTQCTHTSLTLSGPQLKSLQVLLHWDSSGLEYLQHLAQCLSITISQPLLEIWSSTALKQVWH